MTRIDIARQRIHQQHIATNGLASPAEVVRSLGAVQAQDYLGALWAIGLRTKASTESSVEQAIREKKIVRSWPMRGTLHFVLPEDLRWMLKWLSPRVLVRAQSIHRQAELDGKTFSKAEKVLEKILRNGHLLTRTELYGALEKAHIQTREQRGLHILLYLALQGLLCFGPRQEKQQTFVRLDDWLPPARSLMKGEALVKLAQRYFASHGPATLKDFAWWSGISPIDAREALEAVKGGLEMLKREGETYWMKELTKSARTSSIYLLPPYDELTVAYKDRKHLTAGTTATHSSVLTSVMVKDGRVSGTWKRSVGRNSIELSFNSFLPLAEREIVNLPLLRYSEFMAKPLTTTFK